MQNPPSQATQSLLSFDLLKGNLWWERNQSERTFFESSKLSVSGGAAGVGARRTPAEPPAPAGFVPSADQWLKADSSSLQSMVEHDSHRAPFSFSSYSAYSSCCGEADLAARRRTGNGAGLQAECSPSCADHCWRGRALMADAGGLRGTGDVKYGKLGMSSNGGKEGPAAVSPTRNEPARVL